MRLSIISIVLVIATTTMLTGCVSVPRSARETFLSSVPAERAHYIQLYEVSIDSLREQETRRFGVTEAFVQAMRETGGDCLTNSCPAIETRLERIDMISDVLHKTRLEELKALEEGFNPKTDSILFFAYESGTQQEVGFMVVCGSKVKKKIACKDY
jgi:hypothetical protein